MLPDFGVRMPPMHDSNEVLPQPLGPRSNTKEPAFAVRFKPSMGRTA